MRKLYIFQFNQKKKEGKGKSLVTHSPQAVMSVVATPNYLSTMQSLPYMDIF